MNKHFLFTSLTQYETIKWSIKRSVKILGKFNCSGVVVVTLFCVLRQLKTKRRIWVEWGNFTFGQWKFSTKTDPDALTGVIEIANGPSGPCNFLQ